jgi:hypothetical protein
VSCVSVSMSMRMPVYKEGFLLRVVGSSSFSLMQPLVYSSYESSIAPPSLFLSVFERLLI